MNRTLAVGAALAALVVCVVCLVSVAGRSSATNPLSELAQRASDRAPLRGRVEQRLPAGSYTYLALRTPDDELMWAVTLGRGAPAGSEVTLRSMGRKRAFYSRRLDRTFDELAFGIVSRAD